MHFNKVSLMALLVSLALAVQSVGANLMMNGNFDQGSCDGFALFGPRESTTAANRGGPNKIAGWTALDEQTNANDRSNMDWTCAAGNVVCPSPSRCVDLSGRPSNRGVLVQDVATTVVGTNYVLSFLYVGNIFGGANVKRMKVTAGSTSQDFSSDVTSFKSERPLQASRFALGQLAFTATSTTTRIRFEELIGDGFGMYIDTVHLCPATAPDFDGDGIVDCNATTIGNDLAIFVQNVGVTCPAEMKFDVQHNLDHVSDYVDEFDEGDCKKAFKEVDKLLGHAEKASDKCDKRNRRAAVATRKDRKGSSVKGYQKSNKGAGTKEGRKLKGKRECTNCPALATLMDAAQDVLDYLEDICGEKGGKRD